MGSAGQACKPEGLASVPPSLPLPSHLEKRIPALEKSKQPQFGPVGHTWQHGSVFLQINGERALGRSACVRALVSCRQNFHGVDEPRQEHGTVPPKLTCPKEQTNGQPLLLLLPSAPHGTISCGRCCSSGRELSRPSCYQDCGGWWCNTDSHRWTVKLNCIPFTCHSHVST